MYACCKHQDKKRKHRIVTALQLIDIQMMMAMVMMIIQSIVIMTS